MPNPATARLWKHVNDAEKCEGNKTMNELERAFNRMVKHRLTVEIFYPEFGDDVRLILTEIGKVQKYVAALESDGNVWKQVVPVPFKDTTPCEVCGNIPPGCTCFCGPT